MCRRISILWRTGYVSLYRITGEIEIKHGLMYLTTVDHGTIMEAVDNMVDWNISPVWEKI